MEIIELKMQAARHSTIAANTNLCFDTIIGGFPDESGQVVRKLWVEYKSILKQMLYLKTSIKFVSSKS